MGAVLRGQARLSPIACSKELVRGHRPQAAPCPSHLTGDKFLGRKGDSGLFTLEPRESAAMAPSCPEAPASGWSELEAGHLLRGGCQAPHFLSRGRWPWACLPETGSEGLGSRYAAGAAGCTRGSLQPLPTKSPPKFSLGRGKEELQTPLITRQRQGDVAMDERPAAGKAGPQELRPSLRRPPTYWAHLLHSCAQPHPAGCPGQPHFSAPFLGHKSLQNLRLQRHPTFQGRRLWSWCRLGA